MRAMLFIAGALLAASAARAEARRSAPTGRPRRNAVCTVPVGQWQLESGGRRLVAAGTRRRRNRDAFARRLICLKYGLGERSDLQIGFTPYVRVEASGGEHSSGVGDVTVRYKQRLTERDAPVQLALIPFVKLPTAKRGIGNGKVEGGLAVPVSFGMGRSRRRSARKSICSPTATAWPAYCAGQSGQCRGRWRRG